MQAERQDGTNGQGKWCGADCCEGTRRCHLAGSCFRVAVRHSDFCLLWPLQGSTHSRPFLEVLDEMVQLMGQNKKPSAEPGALTWCAELCAEMLTPALCRQRAECFLFMTWSSSISPASTSLLTPHSFSAHSHTQLLHRHENTQIVPSGENVAGEFFFFSSLNFLSILCF